MTPKDLVEIVAVCGGVLAMGAAVVARFAALQTIVKELEKDVTSLTRTVERIDRRVAKLSGVVSSADQSGPHRQPTSDPPEDEP